jgi:hypothetical protein
LRGEEVHGGRVKGFASRDWCGEGGEGRRFYEAKRGGAEVAERGGEVSGRC